MSKFKIGFMLLVSFFTFDVINAEAGNIFSFLKKQDGLQQAPPKESQEEDYTTADECDEIYRIEEFLALED